MRSHWRKESLRETREGAGLGPVGSGVCRFGGASPLLAWAPARGWASALPVGNVRLHGEPESHVSSAAFLSPWWFLPQNLRGVFQNGIGQWMQRGAWGL